MDMLWIVATAVVLVAGPAMSRYEREETYDSVCDGDAEEAQGAEDTDNA
jgi:hypothetical protein